MFCYGAQDLVVSYRLWPVDVFELGRVVESEQTDYVQSLSDFFEYLAGGSASNTSLAKKQLKLGSLGPLGL